MAIGYEGWGIPQHQERYRRVGKRVYGHGDERIDFWEGVGVALGRWWDWARIPQVVINGDGAKWMDEGVHLFSQAIRQLDGFHRARSCHPAAGEKGNILYEALRRGEEEEARKVFDQLRPGGEPGPG